MTRRGKSDSTPGVRLQERDFSILRELGMVLWMGTPQIRQRHFPSDKSGEATRRRLRTFAAHQMIESLDLHVSAKPKTGRLSRYHRLLPYGAEVLTDMTGESPARLLRSTPPKPHTIEHRAGMGEIMLRFNDACHQNRLPESQWYLEYDAIAGAAAKSPFDRRYEICYSVVDHLGQKRRVWPDALASLNIPIKKSVSQLVLAWEFDRGTETQTQLVDKLDPYALWIAAKGFQQHFPAAVDVRVCFVLPSKRRLKNTMDSFKSHRVAPFVRFVVVDEFTPDKILAAPIWYDANGQSKRILPS